MESSYILFMVNRKVDVHPSSILQGDSAPLKELTFSNYLAFLVICLYIQKVNSKSFHSN